MSRAPLSSGFVLEDDPSTPSTSATVSFRDIIPSSNHPRIAGINTASAHSWCESRRAIGAPAWLINRLDRANIERPYKGFSSDGKPDPSIFHYASDEGAPVEAAVASVQALLASLTAEMREDVIRGDVETDDDFRAWSNPELYVNEGEFRCIPPESSLILCSSTSRGHSTRRDDGEGPRAHTRCNQSVALGGRLQEGARLHSYQPFPG